MYLEYFGFKEFPFSLVSDPRFLYLSEDHRRVKSYIEYAMNIQDSFVVCTGEIGAGKTTLINDALQRIDAGKLVASIQATKINAIEFLQSILLEFRIQPYQLSRIQMHDVLKQFLKQQLQQRKKVFLIVDEAQNLDCEVLEEVRYLSDFESNQQKLINVILVGQPELNDKLDQPGMEHILQRIRLRFHIKAMGLEDVKRYIKHRMVVAGGKDLRLFEDACLPMIHQYTGGRLRLINTLCDYSLMYCAVEKLPRVNQWVIQKAVNELQWDSYEKRFGEHKDMTQFRMPVMPSASAKLQLFKHGAQLAEYDLSDECVSIGRHSENDIQIDDHKASRFHVQIISQGPQVFLHDLNSTNGTLVNQKKINVYELRDGDSFSIGESQFKFVQMSQVPEFTLHDEVEEVLGDKTRPLRVLDDGDKTRIRMRPPQLSLVTNNSLNGEED